MVLTSSIGRSVRRMRWRGEVERRMEDFIRTVASSSLLWQQTVANTTVSFLLEGLEEGEGGGVK